jgi:lipoprotein signal peptidase
MRSPGEGLAWLGGLVLALSSFMSWYTVPNEGFTASVTGWHTGALGKLVFFVGLAVLALLILRATGFELPPNFPVGMVVAGLGALGTVIVLVRLISIPDYFVGAGRSIGLWISLLAALLLIAAGLLKSADEL